MCQENSLDIWIFAIRIFDFEPFQDVYLTVAEFELATGSKD
jgi:hypothetical protein